MEQDGQPFPVPACRSPTFFHAPLASYPDAQYPLASQDDALSLPFGTIIFLPNYTLVPCRRNYLLMDGRLVLRGWAVTLASLTSTSGCTLPSAEWYEEKKVPTAHNKVCGSSWAMISGKRLFCFSNVFFLAPCSSIILDSWYLQDWATQTTTIQMDKQCNREEKICIFDFGVMGKHATMTWLSAHFRNAKTHIFDISTKPTVLIFVNN